MVSFRRLVCLLWVGSGCQGGPISDFPIASNDKVPHPGDNGGVGAGSRDAAAPPTSASDAGTVGGGGAVGSADAGTTPSEPVDGGAPDDAGEDTDGAGLLTKPMGACPVPLAIEDAGVRCADPYCALTEARLEQLTSASSAGACVADGTTIEMACDGTAFWAAAACAIDPSTRQVLGAEELTSCLLDGELAAGLESCLRCFAEEASCAWTECGVQGGFAAASAPSSRCRSERCGAQFSACSGLPVPNAP